MSQQPSLQTRLNNIMYMKLPFCKRSNHFESQVNDLDMSNLNPVCCVCRHDDSPEAPVVPIISVLGHLARQLDQALNENADRVANMEPKFLEISRDFKQLGDLCDQLSQDVLVSLENYKKTVQRDTDKDRVGEIIDGIAASETQPAIKQGFQDLSEYTINETTHLTLNKRKTERFQNDVDQNAGVYVNTMQEIIVRLQDILGEMSEWSLIRAADPNSIGTSSPKSQIRANNSDQFRPLAAQRNSPLQKSGVTPMSPPRGSPEQYAKIEDYEVDALNPQLVKGDLSYLNNKILSIDLSSKPGKAEDVELLNQYLAKVSQDVGQLRGIKIDLKSWNLGDRSQKTILQNIARIAESNSNLNVLVLKFCDWNDNSDISANALSDALKSISRNNNNIELFALNLECWHNCTDAGVKNIVSAINTVVSSNKNLQSFSLNMRHWKTCADEAVISIAAIISQLAASCFRLAHFQLNLYDWNKCTNASANAIAKGLQQLAVNSSGNMRTLVLELAYWKEATDVGANAIAKSITTIVQRNAGITNFVANFFNWNLTNKDQLNALRQQLSQNEHYTNFQLAY